ncbi:protein S40-4-like [Cornus florida]|uniref:protein S40-4-like n=1 Tax=Cornus florida TaxID=4283 RepID=UPI00289F1B5C|nr:protein S40-4-like [Cornus florida]
MAARKSYLERPKYIFMGSDLTNNSITSDTQFEFDEADVWNSINSDEIIVSEHKKSIPNSRTSRKPAKLISSVLDRRSIATSLPVNIPDWSKILPSEYSRKQRSENEEDDDDEDDKGDDEDARLPPHEYLARTRTASFSVHEGIGRTLKGRDLSKVRNAIWKQTGFED